MLSHLRLENVQRNPYWPPKMGCFEVFLNAPTIGNRPHQRVQHFLKNHHPLRSRNRENMTSHQTKTGRKRIKSSTQKVPLKHQREATEVCVPTKVSQQSLPHEPQKMRKNQKNLAEILASSTSSKSAWVKLSSHLGMTGCSGSLVGSLD